MPAKSQAQQKAAGAAYAAKKGKIPVSKLKGSALKMYNSMTKKELKDFAATKHDDLPMKKKESAPVRAKVDEASFHLTETRSGSIPTFHERAPGQTCGTCDEYQKIGSKCKVAAAVKAVHGELLLKNWTENPDKNNNCIEYDPKNVPTPKLPAPSKEA